MSAKVKNAKVAKVARKPRALSVDSLYATRFLAERNSSHRFRWSVNGARAVGACLCGARATIDASAKTPAAQFTITPQGVRSCTGAVKAKAKAATPARAARKVAAKVVAAGDVSDAAIAAMGGTEAVA